MAVPNSQLTTIFLSRSEFSVNCKFWLAINFYLSSPTANIILS